MIFEHLFIQAMSAPVIRLGRESFVLWWWPFVFTFFKNMFILLDIILVIGIVMVVGRFQRIGGDIYDAIESAINSGNLSKGKAQRKWEEAQELIQSDNLEDKKRAVSIAEGIMDECLKSANFSGDNLEGRISKIPDSQLDFKDDIVWAYRMKVRLENEPQIETDKEEIERVFYIFERAMKDLNIL
jgi:hypothetical protein